VNAVPELPELLTRGNEREFLEWLFRTKSVNRDAIGALDVDEYVRSYRDPARMTAGFAYYRAVPSDSEQNKSAAPLMPPTLALGAEKGVGLALYHALKGHAHDLRRADRRVWPLPSRGVSRRACQTDSGFLGKSGFVKVGSYLVSGIVGVAVGCLYSLIGVKSPALPLVQRYIDFLVVRMRLSVSA
jgi:hypothetical protein